MLAALNGPSARRFALLRMALGGYVALQFAAWLPHAELLLQARTLVNVPETPFPNLIAAIPSVAGLQAVLVLCSGAGLLLAAGVWRRPLCLVLWYAWACLLERLYFLTIPSDGYVGWLLLAASLIPAGESVRDSAQTQEWRVPRELVLGAWIVLAISYTASGIDKLASPSWRSGDALAIALGGPIASSLGTSLVQRVPEGWFQLATWGALALECAYGPMCLRPASRRLAWLAAVIMHLFVLALMQIESVSIAMLIFHGFVFERAWLPEWVWRRLPVRSRTTEPAHTALEPSSA